MTRDGTTLGALVALALMPMAGCGTSTGTTDATASPAAIEAAGPRTASDQPSTEDLLQFREAAAAAPYWAAVDWSPPTSTDEAARGAVAVVIGTVASSQVPEPRADDLRPYDGAPTLHHLSVAMSVDVDRVVAGDPAGEVVECQVPVLSGGADGIDDARPDADRIAAMAPVGATGVFVVRPSGTVAPVAFQSATGELVAYVASMDGAVAPHTTASLADALRTALAT